MNNYRIRTSALPSFHTTWASSRAFWMLVHS